MKKTNLLFIIFVVLICASLTACTGFQVQTLEATGTDTPVLNMPNPASVFCKENGNTLEIRTAADGSQSGVCIFPDKSECDEWAYFRGECGPAKKPTPKPLVLSAFVDSGQDLGQGDGTGVVVGDVDGDGDVDAFISQAEGSSLLLLNDGAGKLTLSKQAFKPGSGAAFGDLNGDKSLDIFITEETNNEVWLNDGKGLFSKAGQDLVSPESSAVALGDLDSDGDLDAFVTNWTGHPDQVFMNDGNGIFTDSGQKLGNWFGTAVSLGDVDKDGDLDALVADNGESTDNAPVLWLNDGTGRFTDSTQRLGFTNAYAALLGDLDGDGDLDAFIANSNHNGAKPPDKVWLNDGKGIFTDSGQSLGTFYSLTAALADLDNDGDFDAVTGSWKTGPKIWLNDRKGVLTESTIEINSFNSSGVAIADMDGDGDLDFIVSTNTWYAGSGRHKLWLNQP